MSGTSTPATVDSTSVAAVLARLDERSEVTLRILRSLELRVVSAGGVGSRGSIDMGPPAAMASTLSPEDFEAEEAHYRAQQERDGPAEASGQDAEQPSPSVAELDLPTAATATHVDPEPPATARTPTLRPVDAAAASSPSASGHGSPLSPSGAEELLARVAAAEAAANALTLDKEALWDQLEAVEEQRRQADADATRLRHRVEELTTALEAAQVQLRRQEQQMREQAAGLARHDDDAIDATDPGLGSRGGLSRSPSMSLAEHPGLAATPSEFNDTVRSAAGMSPVPSAGSGQTQGELSKFGFKLRYPNLPKQKARRAGAAGPGSPHSPQGLQRRTATGGSVRSRAVANTSFPQSPVTSAPTSQARDDDGAAEGQHQA